MKDYYSILGISQNSDKSEIQKAYRRLAKKYHPDINKAANAHDKFIEISEAYEFLIHQLKHPDKEFANSSDNLQSDFNSLLNQEFERLRQEIREKAQRQAKMRYEEFKKQNEAFQQSGMSDLFLLFKIIGRITTIPIFLFLFLLPIYLALVFEWKLIFIAIFLWPIAGILSWNAYDKRKNYFIPGKFYYSFNRIKHLFTESRITEEKCYYCHSKKADSHHYKIELLKLKDIKLQTTGFRQHNVNYKNKIVNIQIPRSRNAFLIHSVTIVVKILTILLCMIFLNISSYLWRFILGMLVAGILSFAISLSSNTKSNVSYLFSYGLLFRISIWLFIILSLSDFSIHPLNISTTNGIYFAITAILLFDNVLMSIAKLILGKFSSKPIFKQHPDYMQKIEEGYKLYNDINIISVIYPIYTWIFG